jgi:hypothetical protein
MDGRVPDEVWRRPHVRIEEHTRKGEARDALQRPQTNTPEPP